jgi:hypothetical protein
MKANVLARIARYFSSRRSGSRPALKATILLTGSNMRLFTALTA